MVVCVLFFIAIKFPLHAVTWQGIHFTLELGLLKYWIKINVINYILKGIKISNYPSYNMYCGFYYNRPVLNYKLTYV